MDQSFVFKVVDDERSLMIVQTTTQMAHALGMRLVAEGVEDADTAAELITLGVDVFQGYHIAEPMPAAQVASWVWHWSAPHPVAASVAKLKALSTSLNQPIYWAGAKAGTTYELTQSTSGIFVRYLPKGAKVGSSFSATWRHSGTSRWHLSTAMGQRG